MITYISSLLFAFVILGIPLYGLLKRVELFESFIAGGKNGFDIIIKITPFVVGMYVAIGMLQTSGFFTLLASLLAPVLSFIGMSEELLPLALMRPVSGSGSVAILSEIIRTKGPDSLPALTASTILGSTETTIYVIAVYFGAVRVKHYRYALSVGLIADLAGVISSILICKWLFG